MTNNIQELTKQWLEKHPFLKDIGEMNLSIIQILEKIETEPLQLPNLDLYKETFGKGIPVLQNEELQKTLCKPVKQVVLAVTKGLSETQIPAALKKNCQSLHFYAEKNSTDEILGYVLRQETNKIQTFCEKNDLDAKFANFALWLSISHVISQNALPIKLWVEGKDWERNYCPVCGSLPVLAQLKQANDGHQRHLICGSCHSSWTYKRIGCTYCGNEELNRLRLYETDSEPAMRIDVCEDCHTYIKTYIKEGQEAIYLADWTTLHLDLLAEKEGFSKKGSSLLIN